MKDFGRFLLAKESNAIIAAFFAALLPVFYIPTGFIAVIVLALITLQKGPKAGFWVLAWVALPAIAMLVLRRVGVVDFLLLRCVLMWGFASILHRYRAWNVLLTVMTFFGLCVVLAAHLSVPDITLWWQGHLAAYLQQAIESSHYHFDFSADNFAEQLAPLATGLASFFVACTLFLELLVARFWEALITRAPTSNMLDVGFTRIRANLVFVFLLGLFALLAVCKVKWASDFLPVTLFPLCIAGISFLHFLALKKKQWHFLLFFIYAGMILLPAVVAAILAIIAFIDVLVNFRERFKKKRGVV